MKKKPAAFCFLVLTIINIWVIWTVYVSARTANWYWKEMGLGELSPLTEFAMATARIWTVMALIAGATGCVMSFRAEKDSPFAFPALLVLCFAELIMMALHCYAIMLPGRFIPQGVAG